MVEKKATKKKVEKKATVATAPKVEKPVKKVTKVEKSPAEVKETPKKAETKGEVKEIIECTDKNCHIHGKNRVRGRIFEGKVIKSKMTKTIIVEWPRRYYLSKYERFEKRRSKVKAHNPPCIAAKQGDQVRIAECKPISKNKSFIVLEILK
jgi:small subunit ribosomal protein S17